MMNETTKVLTELRTRGREIEEKQTVPPSLMTPLLWTGTESNRRHKDFQSFALPTELPVQIKLNTEYLIYELAKKNAIPGQNPTPKSRYTSTPSLEPATITLIVLSLDQGATQTVPP